MGVLWYWGKSIEDYTSEDFWFCVFMVTRWNRLKWADVLVLLSVFVLFLLMSMYLMKCSEPVLVEQVWTDSIIEELSYCQETQMLLGHQNYKLLTFWTNYDIKGIVCLKKLHSVITVNTLMITEFSLSFLCETQRKFGKMSQCFCLYNWSQKGAKLFGSNVLNVLQKK